MEEAGFKKARVRDLWAKKNLGTFSQLAPQIAAHGAGLYRLSPQ